MKNKLLQLMKSLLPLLVVVAIIAPVAVFAQEAAADAAADAAEGSRDETFFDTLKQGGWVMWIILVASIALVWLTIDGFIRSGVKKIFPPEHIESIRNFFKSGDYVGAYNYCKVNRSVISDIVRNGLAFLPDGKAMTEEAIFSEIMRVKGSFDTRISYLSVIGVCGPMIGLLGTVTGMKGAFGALGAEGATAGAGALAAHIGEVLVATASGLSVSIPAFLMYYLLRNRVAGRIHDVQEVITSLFRKMPYEEFEDQRVGDEEIYATSPVWGVAAEAPAADAPAAEETPAA